MSATLFLFGAILSVTLKNDYCLRIFWNIYQFYLYSFEYTFENFRNQLIFYFGAIVRYVTLKKKIGKEAKKRRKTIHKERILLLKMFYPKLQVNFLKYLLILCIWSLVLNLFEKFKDQKLG
jgi:hypothetical protein